MSVLIKGMQMPKCCRECDAEGHYDNSYGDEYGFFCPFGYKAYTSETRELKRLDNCPLVPVPPHGDLIDRDAARGSIKPWSPEDERNGCTFDTAKKLMYTMLDSAPTIIQADHEEEEMK